MQESSDYLLRTGVHTLQKTSLLRKAVEVKKVDEELEAKREEFRKKMLANKVRMDAIIQKQQKIKERVGKFDKFLKENETKRSRALHKYQLEVKANKLKATELACIQEEIERLQATKLALMTKLEHHKKFHDFMSRFVDFIPEGFLPLTGDNLIDSCIQRYEGLSITKDGIISANNVRSTDIKEGQRQLELLKHERYQQQLLFSQEMNDLLKKKDHLVERNKRKEQTIAEDQKSRRFMASVLGRTLLAINNLAVTCHSRHWPPLVEMSYEAKLLMIKRRFEDQLRVLKLVQRMKEARAEQIGPEKAPTKLPSLGSQSKTSYSKPSVYGRPSLSLF